jgi:GLPGLI family protein
MRLLKLISLLCLASSVHAQVFEAHYLVSKDIIITDSYGASKKLATLNFDGFFYNKGSQYIFFKRPLYLNDFPEGYIQLQEGDNSLISVSLCMDTTQSIYYLDLDSSIMRFRMDVPAGKINEGTTNNGINILRAIKPGNQKWIILNETKQINELKCQKAKRLSSTGNPMWEIWFCPDIPMIGGICGLSDLPGLVVEAECFPWNEKYVLERYETSTQIQQNIFWPAEFNYSFEGKSSSKQNEKQNEKLKKLDEIIKQ